MFDPGYPKEVSYAELEEYAQGDEPTPNKQHQYLVLVFDLAAPLEPQLEKVRQRLSVTQEWFQQATQGDKKHKKAKYLAKKNWQTFLRLLDAEAAGASLEEIRDNLVEYEPESADADHKAKAANKLWRHRKLAHDLRDNPLQILS